MKVSKTAIFLFELMFVILVFTIAAAVCSNIFAKTYSLSAESKDLTMAVLKAESEAERFKATTLDGTALYKALSARPLGLERGFDKDWHETQSPDGTDTVYQLTALVDIGIPEGMDSMDIVVSKKGQEEPLYRLVVKAYAP
ncbi:MAG: hypothetical protein LBD12_03045 [Clostridiales Family XIII bacterium]|jgi:hypothetical protein|nr:hypothetical protein [Clostridiales Family XIII bacterium]